MNLLFFGYGSTLVFFGPENQKGTRLTLVQNTSLQTPSARAYLPLEKGGEDVPLRQQPPNSMIIQEAV